MFDALRAETRKLRRHRATWFLVWIFPVLAALLMLVQLLWHKSASSAPPPTLAAWLEQSAIFLAVPATGVGRFLIAAFVALVFAGEYGWNTWKLIIPARARWQLVAAKWIVTATLVFGAFVLADLIVLAGIAGQSALGLATPPAGVTAAAVLDTHADAAVNALAPIAYSVVWAGFFAVLTRSVMAAVVLAMIFLFFEQLIQPVALIAAQYLPQATAAVLYVLPPYHIANLMAHAKGSGLVIMLGAGERVAAAQATSLLVTIGWIAAAGLATQVSFARQDLN
jgi:ABC-type transport system involved in multi-copper enzyme maturation permease subunit